jgi:hypothetical protein
LTNCADYKLRRFTMNFVKITLDASVTHSLLLKEITAKINQEDAKDLLQCTISDVPSTLTIMRTSLFEEGYGFPTLFNEAIKLFENRALIPMSPTALLALVARRMKKIGQFETAIVRFPRERLIRPYVLENGFIKRVSYYPDISDHLIRPQEVFWLCIAEK